jgi:HD-GYP domain-containing protein (c-di-GMP phosphodiesterase class II)
MASDRMQEVTEPIAESGAQWGSSSRGPIGRVAVAGATIVMLMIVAVGVSVWRSETSATLAGVALGDEKQLAAAVSGHDQIFDRANVFDLNRPLTAARRVELIDAQRKFATTFDIDLKASAPLGPVESRILDRVRAANRQLVTSERAIEPLLGRRVGAVALERLRGQRQTVDSAIDSYVSRNGHDANAAENQSQAAHRDAGAIAITVGALAVLLATLLIAYMINLLKRSFRRIRADSDLLELARLETLQRLALAAEYRDDDTLQHTERVGQLSALVADRMRLAPEAVALIRQAAPLHDVGKLGVSDAILRKAGRLTPEEWELMKRHSAIGAAILAGSKSPVLQLGERIAHWHHERWDGTGYPDGLVRDAIPISARIVAITDVFDALTHERPYKQAWPVNDALAEIEQLAGRQFDPEVVTAFLSLDHQHPSALAGEPNPPGLASIAA